MQRLLFNRDYALLWTAALVSQTGDMIYAIALAWLVLERTRSPAMMGLLLVAACLPGLLASPWAGLAVDRLPRKRLLVAADLVRGSLVGGAWLLVRADRLQTWHVVAAAILLSLASAFFNPAARVAVPRLVRDEELVRANAGMQLISGLTSAAGPLLGAFLVGLLGYAGAFLVNAASFLVSGSLIAFLVRPLGPDAQAPRAGGEDGAWSGLRFLAGNRGLALVILLVFWVHLFFGSLSVALPFLADRLAGRGILNLGVLETALGTGMFLGAALLQRRRTEPGDRALAQAVGGMALGVLLAGTLQGLGIVRLPPYAAAFVVVGAGVALASVFWTTLLQRCVPESMAGRVFALASAAGNLALPLAYGLTGLLLGKVHPAAVLLGSGLTLALLGVLAARTAPAAAA